MTKRNAFTLAEVLITLGIIGVVAAMTMPSLLNSTQGAQFRTGFKKALTVMSQGVVLNIALDDYDLSQLPTLSEDAQSDNPVMEMFRSRLNVAPGDVPSWSMSGNTTSDDNTLLLNDGIAILFCDGNSDCTGASGSDDDTTGNGGAATDGSETDAEYSCTQDTPCYAVIDTNGNKNPNRLVSCDSNSSEDDESCTVTSPTDQFAVRMYGQTVEPWGSASRAVIFKGK